MSWSRRRNRALPAPWDVGPAPRKPQDVEGRNAVGGVTPSTEADGSAGGRRRRAPKMSYGTGIMPVWPSPQRLRPTNTSS
jgi:hypothetical protein